MHLLTAECRNVQGQEQLRVLLHVIIHLLLVIRILFLVVFVLVEIAFTLFIDLAFQLLLLEHEIFLVAIHFRCQLLSDLCATGPDPDLLLSEAGLIFPVTLPYLRNVGSLVHSTPNSLLLLSSLPILNLSGSLALLI